MYLLLLFTFQTGSIFERLQDTWKGRVFLRFGAIIHHNLIHFSNIFNFHSHLTGAQKHKVKMCVSCYLQHSLHCRFSFLSSERVQQFLKFNQNRASRNKFCQNQIRNNENLNIFFRNHNTTSRIKIIQDFLGFLPYNVQLSVLFCHDYSHLTISQLSSGPLSSHLSYLYYFHKAL